MRLFTELYKQGKWAARRHPMYEKNTFGKYAMLVMAIFWAGYLIFFGTFFAFILDTENMEPYHLLNSGLVLILAIDFTLRIPFQKLPTQEIKPYLLLPIKRKSVIDFLLLRSALNGFNLIWLFFFLPFGVITLPRYFGIMGVLTYCIGIYLLMIFNNYWALLCRTLASSSILWYLLPLGVYTGLALAIFLPENHSLIMNAFMYLGLGYITGKLWAFLVTLAGIYLLYLLNGKILMVQVYEEINKVKDERVKASEYRFFDRYGEIGEYMRLEIRLLLRNKVCRNSLQMILCITAAFGLILSFTDIYDSNAMTNFIVVYNFSIFGTLFLSQIMTHEGNYMDGLMSRKESIYTLLRAKYIIYCIAITIPFLTIVPAIFMGKVSLLSAIAMALFTIGIVYCYLFQMAVYNNKSLSLNAKVSSRQNMGTGYQNLVAMGAFMLPMILYPLCIFLFNEVITDWIFIVMGVGAIATSRFWLKNIYNRFMRRRYLNMEGFRNSRE